MLRPICILLVAGLAAGALTGSALAKAPTGLPEGGAIVTEMDALGHALGPAHEAKPSAKNGSDLAAEAGARTTQGRRSLQSYSGCLQVDAWRNSYSRVFGSLVYRWHQVKYWCWQGNRITSVSVSAYPTNVDPNWYYRGLASSADNYYLWCCGISTSGHYSLRQARMENCVLKYGCVGSEYPWVKIWARGDGSYSYSYGS